MFRLIRSKIQSTKKSNQEIEQAEAALTYLGPATKILDHLYLGSVYDVKIPKHLIADLKITHILNVAEEATTEINLPQISTKKMIVEDIIEPNDNQFQVFEEAINFIEAAKQKNGVVLCHCMRGRSRSCTIVIAYLMKKCNLNLKQAYLLVKEKRPPIGPHRHLREQLVKYEMHLKNTSSLSLEDWQKLDFELSQKKL